MVKRRRKRREDGNQGKKGQERREQGSKDRGREELWFWRSHADCHCLAPLFSWTLDFPMIQLAGLLPSCCCYWTKYIPSSNIICSLFYFFKNQIFSPWYLGRGVCRWESLKNYIVNALYSAIFCMCVHGCAPVHSCAEASGRCWVSSSLTFYLSSCDKLSLNLWLAN